MTDLQERAARLTARRAVLGIARDHPELPEPFGGPTHVNFWLLDYEDAERASMALTAAKGVFAAELGVTFARRPMWHPNGLRYSWEAQIAKGLTLALIIKAEHADDAEDEPAPEMAGAAA